MSELDRRYDAALNILQQRIEADDLKGIEACRAFVEITHKSSPTGLPHYWWCGVYLLHNENGSRELRLETSSSPACSPIPVEPRTGGVCSDCVLTEKPILVPDVDAYPGHVVCDSRSKSEIVAPLFDRDGKIAGVIDVDDVIHGSFTWGDIRRLEEFAGLLGRNL